VAERILLVREVLDKQIVDESHIKVGKVDGLILALRAHRPPRVIAIECGTVTVWSRVSRRLGGWVEALDRRLFGDAAKPVRIRFEHVIEYGIDVVVNIDARRTGAFAVETLLKKTIIDRIPGGRPPKGKAA